MLKPHWRPIKLEFIDILIFLKHSVPVNWELKMDQVMKGFEFQKELLFREGHETRKCSVQKLHLFTFVLTSVVLLGQNKENSSLLEFHSFPFLKVDINTLPPHLVVHIPIVISHRKPPQSYLKDNDFPLAPSPIFFFSLAG